jgi:hypothetical protein
MFPPASSAVSVRVTVSPASNSAIDTVIKDVVAEGGPTSTFKAVDVAPERPDADAASV